MKNIKRLLISIICTFVAINTVYADLSCDVKITETGIDPTGFDVVMPICKYSSEPVRYDEIGEISDRKSSYQEAYDSGLELTDIYYQRETDDGKDIVTETGQVPYCASDKRKVTAFASCTSYKDSIKVVCGIHNNDEESCSLNGCTYNQSTKKCTGDYSYCTGTGWTKRADGKCYKSYDYKEEDVKGNVNPTSKCNSETGGSCTCGPVTYGLFCPVYTCERTNVEVGACAPSFEINGQAAYCINPSQGFPKEDGNNYQTSKFNVRECANSYSTSDCGMANILIEGAFHENISDESMNLALRLWSYHTNGTGFDKTGLANRQTSGDKCSDSVYFMTDEDGHKINVYEKTHKYIMETAREKFYDLALTHEYIPSYMENPETNRSTFTGETFEKITCQLNDNMVGVVCGEDKTYRVGIELYFNTLIGNKYMQTHLDHLYDDSEGATPIDATIAPIDGEEGQWIIVKYEREDFEKSFGDREVIKCDRSDPDYDSIKKYCKTTTKVYDERGTEITGDETKVRECRKKLGCIQKTSVEALCRPTKTGYKVSYIKARYTLPKSSLSVRKYVSCGNTAENQIMFAYFPEETPGSYEEQPLEEVTFYQTKICDDVCKNYNLRIEGDNSCKKNDDKYNTSYKKVVSDPSLGCIVNMDSSVEVAYYDHSEEFGVNTNFCRVLCSDRVEYYLADKVEQNSGKSFIYDVRDNTSAYDVQYKLSSVVKQRRSCTSEIYFDNLPKNTDWKKIYGLTNEENEELMSRATWTNLFRIIYNKDFGADNRVKRKENLNQMVYDLYNCNLYANSKFTSNGVYKPQNNTVGNVLQNIKNIYSNDYGLINKNKFNDTVTFDIGANVAEYSSQIESVVGKVGKAAYAVNNVVLFNDESNNFGMSKVKYCKDIPCLTYAENNEDYDYSKFTNTPFEDGHKMYGYDIPVNLYAYFEVNNEVNFYNGDKYQVLPNTGSVTKGTNFSEFYTLPSYTYPLDKYAYNNSSCEKEGNDILCPVTQTIKISTFNRSRDVDRLQTEVNNNNKFTCYVKVDKPELIENEGGLRYVDPTNLFPNGISSKSAWNSKAGENAKNQIEATASELRQTDDLLEYRITMNPEQIKAIRAYNKENGSYVNERVYNCNNTTSGEMIYTNCKSKFLDALRGLDSKYSGSELGTLDPNYRDGISAYTKRQNN